MSAVHIPLMTIQVSSGPGDCPHDLKSTPGIIRGRPECIPVRSLFLFRPVPGALFRHEKYAPAVPALPEQPLVRFPGEEGAATGAGEGALAGHTNPWGWGGDRGHVHGMKVDRDTGISQGMGFRDGHDDSRSSQVS